MVKISKNYPSTLFHTPIVPCPCYELWFLCSIFLQNCKKKKKDTSVRGETFWLPIELCLLIYVHFTPTFTVVLLFLKSFLEAIKCVYVVESIKLFAQSDFNTRLLVIFVLQLDVSIENTELYEMRPCWNVAFTSRAL
jgi:hypothetical protein